MLWVYKNGCRRDRGDQGASVGELKFREFRVSSFQRAYAPGFPQFLGNVADCMSLFRDTRMQNEDSLKKLPRQVVLF